MISTQAVQNRKVSAPMAPARLQDSSTIKTPYVSRLRQPSTLMVTMFLSLFLASTTWAHAQLNLVYVEGNVSNGNGNLLLAFSNDADGNLTPFARISVFRGRIWSDWSVLRRSIRFGWRTAL